MEVASKLARPGLWRKLQLFSTKCLLVILSDSWSKLVWQFLFCYVSQNPFWCFIYWSVHLRQTAYVLFLAKQEPEWMRKLPKKICPPWFPPWNWLESHRSPDRASCRLHQSLSTAWLVVGRVAAAASPSSKQKLQISIFKKCVHPSSSSQLFSRWNQSSRVTEIFSEPHQNPGLPTQ